MLDYLPVPDKVGLGIREFFKLVFEVDVQERGDDVHVDWQGADLHGLGADIVEDGGGQEGATLGSRGVDSQVHLIFKASIIQQRDKSITCCSLWH